jgi:multicomponent Na+:H+ antiporter subunit G
MIKQVIVYFFCIVGLTFDFLGVLGLIRLPDIYNRLQAATKCVTFGSAGILLGVFINFGFSPIGFKALVCIGFVLLTAPVSAHAIARAAHRNGTPLAKGSVIDQYAEDNELKEE